MKSVKKSVKRMRKNINVKRKGGAQELHEKCSGFLMSRKVDTLAQQLVAMGFSQERATIALVLNEGRLEESVAWLFESEEADKRNEHRVGGGNNNLRINISEELSHIADLELKYKCSKQEVERTVVACEGDLEKAEETLRAQKQEPFLVPLKPEENSYPPTIRVPIAAGSHYQNPIMAPVKAPPPTPIQQKTDEKDFHNAKVTITASSIVDPQLLKRVGPKTEWAKPPPKSIAVTDTRYAGAGEGGSNPSHSHSSLQAATTIPHTKTEAPLHCSVGNELNSLQQLGSVTGMQRPQPKPKPIMNNSNRMRSSPLGNGGVSWYPSLETMKPRALMPHILGSRSLNSSNAASRTNQLYNDQLHYQQQPLVVSSNGGSLESSGTNRSDSLWNVHQTLAATSLRPYSGIGTNPPSGPTSPLIDWKRGFPMPQFDYNNVDWRLDSGSSSSWRSGGEWLTNNSYMQNNTNTYDSFTSRHGAQVAATRPPIWSNGVSAIPQTQGGVGTTVGGLLERASPFEEKDLSGLSRPFIHSPQ
ncbi:unnamed protein product [Cuscuta europaea]|uniref:UBA domain-containing protein n=1 Tax=Cuscuta europaea TaxID=41803 RepID=A0A9P1E0X5_CUSEU|nr:unnamed protein product [Cuscuta europaea]